MLNLQKIIKIHFTTKIGIQHEFNSILSRHKDLLKLLCSSNNAVSSLADINVKLTNGKSEVLLHKISTINVIDYQKVEITTLDQQVYIFLCLFYLNLFY